ncbi:MAG: hypothetical protein FJX54_22640 [Alphaproteobacteria bacterium]|nr:hypothetical protein [Alphaproteobacteria bacterium]
MLDLLGLIWDVFAQSAFMRWFLLGALIGLILVIVMIVRGFGIDLVDALGAILLCGLVSAAGRFVYWMAKR